MVLVAALCALDYAESKLNSGQAVALRISLRCASSGTLAEDEALDIITALEDSGLIVCPPCLNALVDLSPM